MSYKKGFTYNNIKEFCEKYRCKLLTLEKDLNSETKIFKIMSSCGHETETSFYKLLKYKIGVYCVTCFENVKQNGATCFKCGIMFVLTDNLFCFCSKKCSGSHIVSDEHKNKTRASLLIKNDRNKDKNGNLKSDTEIKIVQKQQKIQNQRDNGVKEKYLITYETIQNEYTKNNCKLITTKNELDELLKSDKLSNIQLKITSSCGHITNNCLFYDFKNRGTGLLCKACTIDKLKKESINSDGIVTTMIIEKTGFDLIKNLCSEKMEIIKTRECCEADVLARPLNVCVDLWLKIQLKTSITDKYYCFKTVKSNGKKYKNMVMILVHIPSEQFWTVDSSDINVTKITLGKQKSKYDKYKVTDICASLLEWYNKNVYNVPFKIGNTPQSPNSQTEYEFVLHREERIKFIEFINNEIDGLVYDFKIGTSRIQEKVLSQQKKSNCTYVYTRKSAGHIDGKLTKQPYKQGDNDFYWLNLKNKKDFYVVPEEKLIRGGVIATKDQKGMTKFNLTTNQKWLEDDYKFDYDTISEPPNKRKLLNLLGVKEYKPIQEIIDESSDEEIECKPKKVQRKKVIKIVPKAELSDSEDERPKKVKKSKPIS